MMQRKQFIINICGDTTTMTAHQALHRGAAVESHALTTKAEKKEPIIHVQHKT